jgi:lysophospholipase L1-like esterase
MTRIAVACCLALLILCSKAEAVTCSAPASALPTTQPAPRPDFRPEIQRRIQDALAHQSYDAIALGDSILEGWPPELLAQALGRDTLNIGFGSDGTENMLWRLETIDWHGQAPSIVLLLIGTNDLRNEPCSVYWGLLAAIRKTRSVFPKAKLVVISILPFGENLRRNEEEIDTVNGLLAKDAAAENYLFINAHDALLCNHVTPCPLFVPPAFRHLTRAGYEVLSPLVKAGLGQR